MGIGFDGYRLFDGLGNYHWSSPMGPGRVTVDRAPARIGELLHQFGQILQTTVPETTVPALVVLIAHVSVGEEFVG